MAVPGAAAGSIQGYNLHRLQSARRTPLALSYARTKLRIDGQTPPGLRGDFFKTGPAIPTGYQRHPAHAFDGDGFVQNFRFDEDGVSFSGRFVETPKFLSEQARGELFLPSFSKVWPDSPTLQGADDMNTANTSLRMVGDRLMAMWEAGTPFEIDPDTLVTKGAVNFGDEFSGLPFSAHPRRDGSGGWWNFGQILWKEQLVIYRLDESGRVIRHGVVENVRPGMIHDFAVTDRYLVFVVPPMIWDRDKFAMQASFLDSHAWHPNENTSILVIDKTDLSVVRRHEADPFFLFHIGNAYDLGDGEIHLDVCGYDTPDILTQRLRLDADPAMLSQWSNPYLRHLRLHREGGPPEMEVRSSMPIEFPRLGEDLQSPRQEHCVALGLDEKSGLLRYLVQIGSDSGVVQAFDFGPSCHADEYIVVQAKGLQESWVIGTHTDLDKWETRLDLFDLQQISDGPVMRAVLPFVTPPALHGDFVPA